MPCATAGGKPLPPKTARVLYRAPGPTAPHGQRLANRTRSAFAVCRLARQLLTIVRPDTLVRWNRDLFRLFWRLKSRQRGRPRIPIEVQRLIAEMGIHNRTWGEERIAAELRVKLGLTVSPRTVRRCMPPRPRSRGGRSAQSRTTFLHNHAGANTVILAFLVPRHLVHEVASRRATTCAPGLVTPVRPHCGWNQSLPQKRHLLFFRRYEPRRALASAKSRVMSLRMTASSSARFRVRKACTARSSAARTGRRCRHRLLRHVGDTERAKRDHRDSDDRAGLYGPCEVAQITPLGLMGISHGTLSPSMAPRSDHLAFSRCGTSFSFSRHCASSISVSGTAISRMAVDHGRV